MHTYVHIWGCTHTHMHIHTNTHKHIYTYLHSYMHTMNFTYVTGFAKAHRICIPCTMAKNIFITNIIDSSINKLTKLPQHHCQKVTGQLFLRPVRRPWVLRCSLNTAGRLVQVANLLKVTSWLVHDVARPCIYLYFVTFWVQWGNNWHITFTWLYNLGIASCVRVTARFTCIIV